MSKLKVDDYFCPIKGSMHHREYGDFVGRVKRIIDGGRIYWETVEVGKNNYPAIRNNIVLYTDNDHDFENITEIYNSPLYQALK